jgi:hypothetical protein
VATSAAFLKGLKVKYFIIQSKDIRHRRLHKNLTNNTMPMFNSDKQGFVFELKNVRFDAVK